jgi:hypothetical protein
MEESALSVDGGLFPARRRRLRRDGEGRARRSRSTGQAHKLHKRQSGAGAGAGSGCPQPSTLPFRQPLRTVTRDWLASRHGRHDHDPRNQGSVLVFV